MKNNRTRIAAAAACALACLCAHAEVVGTKERTYLVKFKDGAVERYQAVWTAHVTATVKEEGGSPVPFQGSRDNRRCAWTIEAAIDRTVALATRLGPSFPLPAMSRTLKEEVQDRGGDFLVNGMRNETCKEATAPRESAIANARNGMRSLFERLTEADFEKLKKEASANAEVVAITVQ